MPTITYVYAREILDSRGLPTVECSIWLDSGKVAKSSVPSGTSKGKHEAFELRDGDQTRLLGQGVWQAVNNINTIIGPQLIGKDPQAQEEIDQLVIALDGTPNKKKLGANAILAVSQAVAKAGALAANYELFDYIQQKYQLTPQPSFPNMVYTLINGGAHGASNLDIQEFQVIPASHFDFYQSLMMASLLFTQLEQVLISKEAVHSTGLVGGFAPNLYNNVDAFEILVETVKTTNYTYAQDVFMGVDMSASTFFDKGKYILKDKSQPYSPQEMIEYYLKLRKLYHVFYIEDPFQEDDIKWWQQITKELGETTSIVADDLTVTNPERLQAAIEGKMCNAVSIKPNQIGTITETMQVAKMARDAGWQIVIAHRSGETNDSFIADLAVGIGAEYAKFGPPNRGERISKYNRLLEIYTVLQARAAQKAAASTT